MKYTPAFFYKTFPEWKRKKDSLIVKVLFRPLSFITSSIFATLKVSANAVSILSLFVTLAISALFLTGSHTARIIGACLVAFWMVLDCTDGNIARSVKKQAYGEFVDSCSSYCLIAGLFVCIGVTVFKTGGLLLEPGTWYSIFLGGVISISDPLSRLIYHKYQLNSMQYKSKDDVQNEDKGKLRKIQDRIDKEIGLNGIFIPFLIVSAIFQWLDIFMIVYGLYYIAELAATIVYLDFKTIRYNKMIELSQTVEEKGQENESDCG